MQIKSRSSDHYRPTARTKPPGRESLDRTLRLFFSTRFLSLSKVSHRPLIKVFPSITPSLTASLFPVLATVSTYLGRSTRKVLTSSQHKHPVPSSEGQLNRPIQQSLCSNTIDQIGPYSLLCGSTPRDCALLEADKESSCNGAFTS